MYAGATRELPGCGFVVGAQSLVSLLAQILHVESIWVSVDSGCRHRIRVAGRP